MLFLLKIMKDHGSSASEVKAETIIEDSSSVAVYEANRKLSEYEKTVNYEVTGKLYQLVEIPLFKGSLSD